MKEMEFMKALGNVPQDTLDELAEWQEAGTPIREKAAGRVFSRNLGVGAALAACAVIAVSVGKEGYRRMLAETNTGAPVAEQLSAHEPIEIADYKSEGFDVVMDIPENGTAQLLHSFEEAKPWIKLVRQNGEYGRETGEGAEDFRELLENKAVYQEYDIIMAAVPYQYNYPDHGVAMYGFRGGTITESGKLTVEAAFLTVGTEMRERMFEEIKTFCCCFAVPKNTVPDITEFQFQDVIFDCTGALPDGCDTREEHLEYLYSLPNYQKFMEQDGGTQYLRR